MSLSDRRRHAHVRWGDEALIEAAPNDDYWRCGKWGTGKNRVGALLTELRDALRTDATG